MAHTARSEDEKKEYFDPPDVLESKVDQLVQWIRESKHMITFTGAGVSTAAGIPDFRSGMNTSLSTGPGAWELRAKLAMRDTSKYRVTSTSKAIPTPTHMMFVKLQQEGILKCCVSQNTDGLHKRSGLPKSALAELHGNSNLEICKKCKREYLRDYCTRTARGVFCHETGRKCDNPSCRGDLYDTIINFGENLPESEIIKAFNEAEVADLCLAMGSSLTVTPAANVPERVAERGKHLVIVNLQKTPLNRAASLIIHAKCEDVSQMIMDKLGLEIPQFRLKRLVVIKESHDKTKGDVLLTIEGQDQYGFPFSMLKTVSVRCFGQTYDNLHEPYSLSVPWVSAEDVAMVTIRLHFHGHYREPPVERDIVMKKGTDNTTCLNMSYNPFNGEWTITRDNEEEEEQHVPNVSNLSLH